MNMNCQNIQTEVFKNQFSFTRQQKLLIVETGGKKSLLAKSHERLGCQKVLVPNSQHEIQDQS